jgi:hypothetical protein
MGYCDKENKKRYWGRVHAERAIRRNKHKDQWDAIRSYRCRFCGGWHLTAQKTKEGKN